jgi:hypothetical protein
MPLNFNETLTERIESITQVRGVPGVRVVVGFATAAGNERFRRELAILPNGTCWIMQGPTAVQIDDAAPAAAQRGDRVSIQNYMEALVAATLIPAP